MPNQKNQSCNVCSSAVSEVFRGLILKRYNAAYFHCASCGLLATENPYWLSEAYSDGETLR